MPWTGGRCPGPLLWLHCIVLSLTSRETNVSPGPLPPQCGWKAGSPVQAIQDANRNGFLQYQQSKLSRFPRLSDISVRRADDVF